jgi:HK97 family phage portal protein
MASTWQWIYGRVKGGWRTVGAPGSNFFQDGGPSFTPPVGQTQAMKLSAFFSCIRLLSFVHGALPLQAFEDENKPVKSLDVVDLLRFPNDYQTGDAFVGGMAANMNVHGNSMAFIKAFDSSGNAYALDFYASEMWDVSLDKQGRPAFKIDGESVPNDRVLHWSGLSMNGYWGIPTLAAAVETLSMQIQSNESAGLVFANGLRAGGFFEMPENKQAFDDIKLGKFREELKKMSQPGNTAKWLPLLPGMKAVANLAYRIDPVSAELLASRHFGIEEICRFLGVPPPLIGHTDKASSWASSLEHLNQFLVTYGIQPPCTRFENQMALKLLGRNRRNRIKLKFNMDALLRGDILKRFQTYEIGRENGIICADEARALENYPPVPDGKGKDFTPVGKAPAAAASTKKEPTK